MYACMEPSRQSRSLRRISLNDLWGDRLIAEYSEFDLIPANLC